MMEKLHVTFEGIRDTTGYLFSFAKCLIASLRCSPFADRADDVIAASGFAFRMWVDGKELCPSATSIWDFKQQKPWVENSGLVCRYVERLWHEEALEPERRAEAIRMICESIDGGFAPVVWDVSGCEWGIIIGYDDEQQMFATLKVDGSEAVLSYEKLGRLEIPILSVLAVTGKNEKIADQLVADTRKLAAAHLRGEEWCENAQGLAAYDALIDFIREKLTDDTAWNLEYMLGTYAALKWYAWQFFERYGQSELAALYQTVHEAWQQAFETRDKEQIIRLMEEAHKVETRALEMLEAPEWPTEKTQGKDVDIQIRKLTSELAEDYVHFFDVTPHDVQKDEQKCYCVTWRSDDSYEKNSSHWFPTREERRAKAIEFVRNGSLQGYLAYCGGQIVGWCNANANCQQCIDYLRMFWPIQEHQTNEKIKSIFCFVIAPEMQRKGVATKLLQQVIRDAAEEGFDFVEAYANKAFVHNIHEFRGPMAMYEKCGFARCGEQDGKVVMRKALK